MEVDHAALAQAVEDAIEALLRVKVVLAGEAPAPKSKQRRPKLTAEQMGNDDAVRLLGVMADALEARGMARPNVVRRDWYGPMDLLVRKDLVGNAELAEAVLKWAIRDDFWGGVIVNPESLRRNFPKLVAKFRKQNPAAVVTQADAEREAAQDDRAERERQRRMRAASPSHLE